MSETPFRQTIAARLLMLVLAVALPLFALQLYNALGEAETERQQAFEQAQKVADDIRSRIELQMHNLDSLLYAVAVAVPLTTDLQSGNRRLSAMHAGMPDYVSRIMIARRDGSIMHATGSEALPHGATISDRAYFREALAGNGLVIGEPFQSRLTRKWIVPLARPVPGADGDTEGVVTLSILLEQFQTSFDGVSLPRGALVTVFSRQGVVVARSMDVGRWIGKDLTGGMPVVRELLEQKRGTREVTTSDGVKRLSAISASDVLPWLVYVGIPSDRVLGPSRAKLSWTMLLTVLVTVLALGVAAWLARGIAVPLRRLALDAVRLAGGELGHRSRVQTTGEVKALARSFNAMAHELEQRNKTLQAMIEQAAVGIARVSPDGCWLQCNQRLCDMLGYPCEELRTRPLDAFVDPEDVDKDNALKQRLLNGEIATYEIEKRLVGAQGQRIWTNSTVSLVRRDGGEADYFLLIIEDITERKKSRDLIAGQKMVLEMIAHGAPLSNTLTVLMRIIEEQADGMLCSILLLDEEGKRLQHGAAPSLPEKYQRAIDGTVIGACVGSCGTAAYRRKAVYVEDIATDPLWADYRDVALESGLRACWSTPLFDAKGQLLGTFAMYYRTPGLPNERHLALIDVATQTAAIAIARTRAEKALHAKRSLLEQVMRCSPVGIFSVRMDGMVSLVNQATLDLVGETREQVMQRAGIEQEWRVHNLQGQPMPPSRFPFEQAMQPTAPVVDHEYVVLRPDGRKVVVSVNSAPLLDEHGTMEGMVFVMQDITERQKMLADLRASEEKFSAAFHAGPIAIFITAIDDGTIVEANEAATELTGYAHEELIGYSAINLWTDPQERARYGTAVREHGRVSLMEARFRRKSGEIRDSLLSGALLHLDGKPHILTVVRDVTRQKQVEEEIRTLNNELEQRVADRTAELAAANRELEAFSYSVSHDLKAPLRGIDGYSQLLEEAAAGKLDEESRLFLHNIRRGVAQMHELIADLLAYARMERRSLDNVQLNLQTCVEAAMQESRHALAGDEAVNGNDVAIYCAVPALMVRGDQEGLAVVLRNLIDNAIKFSRASASPAIEIGAREQGDKAVLWVRDNGIGFDMKFHDRIFDIFSRLQRSEEYPGTGVGLALVRKAMQRMGGRVWAESAPGQGATFYIELIRV